MSPIGKNSFRKWEDIFLGYLLRKVAKDGYRWPTEESMRAAHGVVSMWAPELVILRRSPPAMRETVSVLLKRYDGGIKEFRGKWHLPGGYNRWNQPDIATTVNEVALRELGVEAEHIGTIDAYKWQTGEHPYGHPLSLYILAKPRGMIMESDSLRFFDLEELPEDLLPVHRRFLEGPELANTLLR